MDFQVTIEHVYSLEKKVKSGPLFEHNFSKNLIHLHLLSVFFLIFSTSSQNF